MKSWWVCLLLFAAVGCSDPNGGGSGAASVSVATVGTGGSGSGGDAASGGAGGAGSSSSAAGGGLPMLGPGTLTITSDALAGYEGMTLVAVAVDGDIQPAAICATIEAASFTGTLKEKATPAPCVGGPDAKLAPRTYFVHVTVFSPDLMTQLACLPALVEVNGDVVATLPPPAPCE
ncbi:MAG: hypothetical protein EXR75_01515 [Myxococcales bacterium]|nr:hypothetical protein [Myxococcales bacterium]